MSETDVLALAVVFMGLALLAHATKGKGGEFLKALSEIIKKLF